MAGGIAHDFNNLLTPIVGETSLALLDLPNGSALRKSLLKIQRAAHRAAALTNQMLSYSGQGPQQIEPMIALFLACRPRRQRLATSGNEPARIACGNGP